MTDMEKLFRHAPGGEYRPTNILMPSTKEQMVEKLKNLHDTVLKYPAHPSIRPHLRKLLTNIAMLECHGVDGHIEFLRKYLDSLYRIAAIVEFYYRRRDLLPDTEQDQVVCYDR